MRLCQQVVCLQAARYYRQNSERCACVVACGISTPFGISFQFYIPVVGVFVLTVLALPWSFNSNFRLCLQEKKLGSATKQALTPHLHSFKLCHKDYACIMTMERLLWIYMPFFVATLCIITGFVTGFPTAPTDNTDIVTDLVEVNDSVTSGTTQPSPQYASINQSEVPTSLAKTGDTLNQTANNAGQTTINPVSSLTEVPTNVPEPTMTTSPTTMTPSMPVDPTSQAVTMQSSIVTPAVAHTTTNFVATTLPTKLSTPTTLSTPTQALVVKTSSTPVIAPVHETTLTVSTTPSVSTSSEASTTSSKTTHIPDNQTTKESGDWSIIGITGNSFTGKILLPIAVGTALSVIIIAVAYCYCSRRGSHRLAKSSRNGVHRMTSNDRVMLLADSSEDEF